jgi:hypothetical protein
MTGLVLVTNRQPLNDLTTAMVSEPEVNSFWRMFLCVVLLRFV